MVAERCGEAAEKGRERRAEATGKGVNREEQIAGNAGRRRLLRDDGVVLGNSRKRGAAFGNLSAYAFSHMRIFSFFHGIGERVERGGIAAGVGEKQAGKQPASEKDRQGSNRRRRKAQA